MALTDQPTNHKIIKPTELELDEFTEIGAPLELLFHDLDDPITSTAAANSQDITGTESTLEAGCKYQFPPLADSLQSSDLNAMAALRDRVADGVDLQSAMSKVSIDLPSAVLGKKSWSSIGSVLRGVSGASGRGFVWNVGSGRSERASESLANILRNSGL